MAKNLKNDTQVVMSKHANFLAIVKNENGKFIVCAGQWKLTEREFDTPTQAEQFIGTKPYELIFNLIALMVNLHDNEKTKQTKSSEQEISKDK